MIPPPALRRSCVWLAPLCLTVGLQSAPATPPASFATLEASVARLKRITLPNGMTLLLHTDSSAPVVSIQVWVGTGSIHEDNYLGAGLSHYVEHMIFKGTPKRPRGEISRAIHDAGGKINAYTSLDRTVFYTDLPARHCALGVDVLLDALQNAEFPADECAREKEVILREMAMCNDDPDRLTPRCSGASPIPGTPSDCPSSASPISSKPSTAMTCSPFSTATTPPTT